MNWLVPDWKDIASKAYSVWFAIVALIILHAADVIYLLTEQVTNPASWTWLLHWFLVAIIVSRFVPQPQEHKWKRRAAVILFILLVCGINGKAMACEVDYNKEIDVTIETITRWEGKRNVGYLDTIASPPLPTDCYGHTKTAVVGLRKSDAVCISQLREELHEYRDGVRSAFTERTKSERLTPHRGAAFTSWAYNIGIRAATKSTSIRRINRGDIKGACEAMTWYNRSGGRFIRGLANRRDAESSLCIKGLTNRRGLGIIGPIA